jgi:hypothetical protein
MSVVPVPVRRPSKISQPSSARSISSSSSSSPPPPPPPPRSSEVPFQKSRMSCRSHSRHNRGPISVSFHNQIQVMADTSDPLTDDEKYACWYQKSDYQRFKKDIVWTIQQMTLSSYRSLDKEEENKEEPKQPQTFTLSSSSSSSFCTWGLDRALNNKPEQPQQRPCVRHCSIQAVLVEQERQFEQCVEQHYQMSLLPFGIMNKSPPTPTPHCHSEQPEDDNREQCRIAQVYQQWTKERVDSAHLVGLRYAQEERQENGRQQRQQSYPQHESSGIYYYDDGKMNLNHGSLTTPMPDKNGLECHHCSLVVVATTTTPHQQQQQQHHLPSRSAKTMIPPSLSTRDVFYSILTFLN